MSTTTKPLYVALANLLQRRNSLSRRLCEGRQSDDRYQVLAMKSAIEDELGRLVKEHMPSGSGFDKGTTLVTGACFKAGDPRAYPYRLVFSTAFHHMDEHGGYTKWTEHEVIITPDWIGFDLKVTGRDHRDIKDYIGDVFHGALMAEVAVTDIPPKPEAEK